MYKDLPNWDVIFEILLDDDGRLAARCVTPFTYDPSTLGAICTVLFDVMTNNMDENKQIDFEREAVKFLHQMLEERHQFITKETLPE